jgi:protein-disulfide isomerase
MQLGVELGLTGTPYSVTDKGEIISGYAPAPQLAARLDGRDPRAAGRAN